MINDQLIADDSAKLLPQTLHGETIHAEAQSGGPRVPWPKQAECVGLDDRDVVSVATQVQQATGLC